MREGEEGEKKDGDDHSEHKRERECGWEGEKEKRRSMEGGDTQVGNNPTLKIGSIDISCVYIACQICNSKIHQTPSSLLSLSLSPQSLPSLPL